MALCGLTWGFMQNGNCYSERFCSYWREIKQSVISE
jgi:hypothetical protein